MMNRHRDASSSSHTEPLKAPSRGLLARPGRVIAMASVLAVAPMVTGFPQFSAPAGPHPVTAHVHKVGFVKSSVAALRTARNATGSVVRASGAPDPVTTARAAAVTPVQDVAGPVTVVGVSWPRGAVSAHGQFQIRTLSGSTWSQWQSLDVETGGPDPAEAAAASAPGGTSPYIVTGASKYEVRSLTTDATVPAAATVQAVDPGTSSADSVQPAPGAASAATARPAIYTRAQWGANEGLRRAGPSYGTIQVGFVHHTDSANNYSSASVPAMIRGMYAYHVQTLGWNDIGYNFLVDRFGRIWEGRYGGMDKPVVGAQTLNYNSVSLGVSAIGQYDVAAVPQAMTNAFKAVFAWKFSLANIPATGTSPVVYKGKYLQRVSGHRNAFSTACPGRYLYAKLPEIRAGAAAIIAAANRRPIGAFDAATSTSPGVIAVRGWALDPDTTSPINVHVYVDGVVTRSITANTPRPDVGRIFGKGNNHGFASTIRASAGAHQVCVYAINTPAGPNPRIGCKNLTVPR